MSANETVAFGRYLLESKLATGGMGEIFLARIQGAAGFEKKVVIKRILPHLAESPEFVDRFLDEGRLVVQLSHGNIAQVLDMGQVDGHYYLAMEYIDGLDLRALMRGLRQNNETIPPHLVLHILGEVARGLAYAHDRLDDSGRNLGIIHRDVSPSNVIISREGEVKLLDFGIAKAASRLANSVSGTLHGKFLYMSPEQAAGQNLDRRSDLFSLGVCAYEMLTGVRPFNGKSELQTLELIRRGRFDRITAICPEVPSGVEAIINRCMMADPADRYPNADAVRKAALSYTVKSGSVVSGSDLGRYVSDYLKPKAPPAAVDLDDALNAQLDAMMGVDAPAAAGTQVAAAKLERATDPGAIAQLRMDTNTKRARLADMTDADMPRASRNRILVASVLLLVGVLVTLNVVMLWNLREGQPAPTIVMPDAVAGPAVAAGPGAPIRPGALAPAPAAAPLDVKPAHQPGPPVRQPTPQPIAEAQPIPVQPPAEETPEPGPTIAPPEPTVAGPMRLRLADVPPDAFVTIGGALATAASDGTFEVPEGDGKVAVVVSAPGHTQEERVLDRQAGATVAISPDLKALKRTIRVTVKPKDAQIVLGGRVVGTGSYRAHVQSGTPMRGKATMDGYHDEAFQLRYSGPRSLTVRLEPRAMGKFMIRVFPVSAEVRLNGSKIGRKQALVSRRVPPGEHKLEVRSKAGTRRMTFVVRAGETTALGQVTIDE